MCNKLKQLTPLKAINAGRAGGVAMLKQELRDEILATFVLALLIAAVWWVPRYINRLPICFSDKNRIWGKPKIVSTTTPDKWGEVVPAGDFIFHQACPRYR